MEVIGAWRGHHRCSRRPPLALLEQEAELGALASGQEDEGWTGRVAKAETAAARAEVRDGGRVDAQRSRVGQIEWVSWGPHKK
jgi:hypothetical protein